MNRYVLVSAPRHEAYGLNVQEAHCRGLPDLVSASAGVAERYPLSRRSRERRQDTTMIELSRPLVESYTQTSHGLGQAGIFSTTIRTAPRHHERSA